MTPRRSPYQTIIDGTPTASTISIALTLLKEASATIIAGQNANIMLINNFSDFETDEYAISRNNEMRSILTIYMSEKTAKYSGKCAAFGDVEASSKSSTPTAIAKIIILLFIY